MGRLTGYGRWPALVALALGALGCEAEESKPGEADAAGDVAQAMCEWDDSLDWRTAVPLTLPAAGVEGQICPLADADWYRFNLEPGQGILQVDLAIEGGLSPVQPTYALMMRGEGGEPIGVAGAAPPDAIAGPISARHCLGPGSYYLIVRDYNDDAQDFRRSYVLGLSTASDPDASEPNGGPLAATPLTPGTPVQGRMACAGDEDFFAFELAGPRILRLSLETSGDPFDPRLELRSEDGAVLVSETRYAGPGGAPSIERYAKVEAGSYYVVVADEGGDDASPDARFTLLVETFVDADDNEPNEHPSEATPLRSTSVACGREWTELATMQGSIASPGDEDWYLLPLEGCQNGLIEAELSFDRPGLTPLEAWGLQARVQAAMTLVRADPKSPCAADSECQFLKRSCKTAAGCAGYGVSCQESKGCIGASVCLPEGLCGAQMIERHVQRTVAAWSETAPPPPNRVVISAPILADEPLLLKVSDYQTDGAAPGSPYTLKVRVRIDPDGHEPSNRFYTTLDAGYPVNQNADKAADVPVHRCIPPLSPDDPAPDCCGPDTWIEGSLGYENDLDWYHYTHPCPDGDCLVRVLWEVDPGPVDVLFLIYAGDKLWFNALRPLEEKPSHALAAGHFGGADASDTCFYAWRHHGPNYYVVARDLAVNRDWDADQRYRFCVERVARGCETPCRFYPPETSAQGKDGCGQ